MIISTAITLAATAGIDGPPIPDHYIFEDTPYLSAVDSPFAGGGGPSGDDFFLEDFEDGALNVPGVTASNGQVLTPGFNTDSVDFDDGSMDGVGLGGHSYFIPKGYPGVDFTFDSEELGGLPTNVGLVWTDGHPLCVVLFEAFDVDGESLGLVELSLGNDGFVGGTNEDRFIGVSFDEGIASINIRGTISAMEVDHLQWGGIEQVPAPGALALLGLAGLAGRRRRR